MKWWRVPRSCFRTPLGRNPKPLKFIPVDDHLTLKDSTNEIDIYHPGRGLADDAARVGRRRRGLTDL